MTLAAEKTLKASPSNRHRILRAAGSLFRRQGFHGTSTRDIADKAGVSLGNIYNHFKTKEELFVTLLEEHEAAYFDPSQPLVRALAQSAFPGNMEAVAAASRKVVDKHSDYILLIYVDVVEFGAAHVAKLFRNMRERYTRLMLDANGGRPPRLAPGVDPASALMLVTWSFFNYFTMEKLFGVKGHYGVPDEEVVRQFSAIFRHGVLPAGRTDRET